TYREEIGWEGLIERARKANMERTLYYSLFLMPDKWKTFDISIMERLKSFAFGYGERLFLRRLKKGQKIPYSGDTLFLLNVKGMLKKTRFLARVIFSEEEIRLKDIINPILFIRFLMDRLGKIGRFIYDITVGRLRLPYGVNL
ncbi:MAG: hypothetical protein HY878_05395, partial [Deltaproteobacteria bacterium]|nr:hypothetical protein [Deltaproteobacteria bacterium]